MAIYTVGRRRVIVALLLTSALLLTLDLRGNDAIDRVRDAFTRAMVPVESVTGVITNPIERMWNGVVNFDDLERENQALQDQVDRLIGTQAAAEAAVIQGQELQALYNLPSLSGIETEVAQVVGYAANNLDQVIEINKGRATGIEIGMPVVNQAGLIGKITSVTDNSARVMLLTDARYTVAVKVTSATSSSEAPENTTPSGLTPEELEAAGTIPTTTAAPVVDTTAETLPDQLPTPDSTLPGPLAETRDSLKPFESAEAVPITNPETGEPLDAEALRVLAEIAAAQAASDATSTTTLPEIAIEKEFGALEGRGRRLLPQIRFLQDNLSLTVLQEGDLVETAGGSASLAPTGIPIGRVANRADRPGSGGPLLDVEVNADLARLNFVRVVLYKPLTEDAQ